MANLSDRYVELRQMQSPVCKTNFLLASYSGRPLYETPICAKHLNEIVCPGVREINIRQHILGRHSLVSPLTVSDNTTKILISQLFSVNILTLK